MNGTVSNGKISANVTGLKKGHQWFVLTPALVGFDKISSLRFAVQVGRRREDQHPLLAAHGVCDSHLGGDRGGHERCLLFAGWAFSLVHH